MQRYCAFLVLLVSALSAAQLSHAHSAKLGAIEIGHIWTRATAPGAKAASVYAPFRNTGTISDSLTGADTPVAERVEIHETHEENGVVKMRMLETLELPPGKPVAMRPGGKHLMLVGLKRPLKKDESFPLTLHFFRAGSIEVQVMAEDLGAKSRAR